MLEALDLAKTLHNLSPLEIAYAKHEGKKRKIKDTTMPSTLESAPPSLHGEEDTVSLGSLEGTPLNGTRPRWDEIDDMYVYDSIDIPSFDGIETEEESAKALQIAAECNAACQSSWTYSVGIEEQLLDMEEQYKFQDYMIEFGGEGSVQSFIACKHKAHVDSTVLAFERAKKRSVNEINRSLLILNLEHMLATGEIKPHLCFSCKDCNDNCNCGTGTDWVMDSGASHHLTSHLSDFSSYKTLLGDEQQLLQTASAQNPV